MSTRSSWCLRCTTRSFCVVRIEPSRCRLASTPSRLSSRAISAPASSRPTTDSSLVRAPSAAQLRATLAAPPGRTSSRCHSTTGTGASGEMREASPYQ